MSVTRRLFDDGLIEPPRWLPDNIMFEGIVGSNAYGCENPTNSKDPNVVAVIDHDIMGIIMPPKVMIFPHLGGHIHGFDKAPETFENFQAHHVHVLAGNRERVYDLTLYGIVKFFNLSMACNPNIVELAFLPQRCVIADSQIYRHIRDNRKLFLHKGAYQTFKNYAHSQLAKLDGQFERQNPRRQSDIDRFGYDTKFAYHLVRLMLECEQILGEYDLILDRDKEIYKSIRRGEWTTERIKTLFDKKEHKLGELYESNKVGLPDVPDVEGVKNLLIECLEIHYGNLQNAVVTDLDIGEVLNKIDRVVTEYRRKI